MQQHQRSFFSPASNAEYLFSFMIREVNREERIKKKKKTHEMRPEFSDGMLMIFEQENGKMQNNKNKTNIARPALLKRVGAVRRQHCGAPSLTAMQMRQRSIIGHDFPSFPSLPLCLIRVARGLEGPLVLAELTSPSAEIACSVAALSLAVTSNKPNPLVLLNHDKWCRSLRPTVCIPVYTVNRPWTGLSV
jgi:hypothetical protein